MRIVAGSARGRTIAAPKSDDVIRPTADRVRETVFNVLGQRCDDLEVLDLFAGTGALGLEALSRGATKAVLVDRHREAIALCRQNLESLRFSDRAEVLPLDVFAALAKLKEQGRRFQLVFADPPYAQQVGARVLEAALPVVDPGGVVVIETGRDEPLDALPEGVERVDTRLLGLTTVHIFRLASTPA